MDLLRLIVTLTYSNADQPQKASRRTRGLTVPVNGEKAR
jgi:hypothetical protein